MYASILIRLSKQAGDSNLSLLGMEADCRAAAAEHGYLVRSVHVDDGISGAVRNRPGFVAWLDEARAGHVECLIAWSGDRLTREGVNALGEVLDVLEGKDPVTGAVTGRPVRLLTANDNIDSHSSDEAFRLTFLIKGEMARAERRRIVERNTANQRRLREQVGRFRGGEPPYGYVATARPEGGKTLVPSPEEAAVIREMADRVISGESLYAIAKDLNERGVATRRARTNLKSVWGIQSIRSILTGVAANGYVTHKGSTIRGADGLPLRYFEAILDDTTSDHLRTLVRPPSRRRHAGDLRAAPIPRSAGRRAKVTRLLSNLLSADCCGGAMYAVGPSVSKPHARYQQPVGTSTCRRQVAILAEEVEALVEQEFIRRFGRLQQVRVIRDAGTQADEATIDLAMRDVAAAMTAPGADITFLGEQMRALHTQRSELHTKIPMIRETYEPTGRTIRQVWDSSSLHARNALLAAFLEGTVRIKPGIRPSGSQKIAPERVVIPWRGTDPTRTDYLAGQPDD